MNIVEISLNFCVPVKVYQGVNISQEGKLRGFRSQEASEASASLPPSIVCGTQGRFTREET